MKDRFRPVPQSRLGRLAALGQIAGGVATGCWAKACAVWQTASDRI